MEQINVLISGDNRIAKYFSVLMVSVFENHKNYEVHFWCLHHRIDEENLTLMADTAYKYKQHFHPIVYNPQVFSHSSFSDEWPVECFYWFLAHQYLPSEIERAIYLDSDTLVCGDFTEFYFADFEDNFLLAAGSGDKQEKVRLVTDTASRIRCSTHNNAYCIFCTGSLVINLTKLRDERITIETLVEANEQRLKMLKVSELFADQGLANYLFYNKTKFFPGRFQSAIWGQTKESFADIRIFHFMGRPKPWEEYFETPFYNKYSPNVFENMPYWVDIIQKWWFYARLVDNYEALLFEVKEIFYRKIEHLFRKYVSQKSIANILKKQIKANVPLQVAFPQAYVPEADATAWSQIKVGNYRLFEKISNSNYKKVKFPLLSVLCPAKSYRFEILAHSNKPLRLPLVLSDYSCSKAQFLFTMVLSENKNMVSYQFRPNSDIYDCLYFDSTKIDVGTKVIVYEISLAEDGTPPPVNKNCLTS
jgi:lipopolysaccharide biosynthesis glycosyltransferase